MVELWAENAVCSLNDFDAGECRRDQRRLEAHTLPVSYLKVKPWVQCSSPEPERSEGVPTLLVRSDQEPKKTAQTPSRFWADDHPGAVLRRRGLVRPPPVLRGSAPMALLHPHHSNHLRSCMGLFCFSDPPFNTPTPRLHVAPTSEPLSPLWRPSAVENHV